MDDIQPVMVTDAGVNSHPIVVEVNHPDQINEVFDAISYSKVFCFSYSSKYKSGLENTVYDLLETLFKNTYCCSRKLQHKTK